MTLRDYIFHYFNISDCILFFAVSLCMVLGIHYILLGFAKRSAKKARRIERADTLLYHYHSSLEKYYELMFSASSILFFTGIYFLLDYDYFSLPGRAWTIWSEYGDFILLGFIVISIIFNSIIDHVFIPLRVIKKNERSTLRMAGMVYMLIIFAYIKFIDLNDNYDRILFYFLTMIIGRFVYFDASFEDFAAAMKDLKNTFSTLLLVLLSTAILAAYGFGSGYLLRSNGVVVSVFIAHFYVIVEIFFLTRLGITKRIGMRAVKRLS